MDEEKIRAFVSLDLPEKFYHEIEKIQKQLPGFKGKLIASENLHLTLKFLGEIDKETLEKVQDKLKNIKCKEFEARISSIGVFSKRRIKIVWLKLENTGMLQKRIDEALSEIEDFEKENRFMSHLTIARVKSVKNKNYFLGELNKIKVPKIKFKVKEFLLKKSTLYPEGPVYEVLESYFLLSREE